MKNGWRMDEEVLTLHVTHISWLVTTDWWQRPVHWVLCGEIYERWKFLETCQSDSSIGLDGVTLVHRLLTGSPPSTATSLLSSLDIVLAEGELNLFSASLARARLHFGLARREGEETLGAPDSWENVYQKRKTASDSLNSRYDLRKVC